jgi:Mn-dependent DtxR family transcriptional regulator
LSQLRYDLSQLRAKGLVQKVERPRGYRLKDEGYRVCLFFLKVHQRLLAPLTSATREPSATDAQLPEERRSKLDRLYVQLDRALEALSAEVGLRPAA